jgi:DNA-binding transcriptional LysR family regulator
MATIDLNRVAVFVRVVEAGSFTAAAKAMGLPVSSVSRSVANLEEELGVRLLHRTTRKLSVTDDGREYFQRVQAAMAAMDDANDALAGGHGQPRGLVRIAAPVDLVGLPATIGALVERYPGLVIDISLSSRRVDLVEEGIDLALRGGRLEDSSLVVRKLGATPLQMFAAPDYLERRGRPRVLADLARHQCIIYRSRAGKVPWRLTGPRGEETAPAAGAVIADDMMFARDLAAAGGGIALVPSTIAAHEVATGRLVRVLPRYAFPAGALYLVWPSRRLIPARVAVVRDFLIEELPKRIPRTA